MRDLADGRQQSEQLRTLRDDVDKLRAQSIELRERLDSLAPKSSPAAPAARKRRRPAVTPRVARRPGRKRKR